jgi:transcriptional regulator with XRE-family HTH domain
LKLNLRSKAIKLRRRGYSIADIAKRLRIAESTASLWCRAVKLTPNQIAALSARTHRKLDRFFKLVEKQREKRQKTAAKIITDASTKTECLTNRELFIAGVSLYWAEGFKHSAEKRVGFCNSDPEMMRFVIRFLKTCLGVKPEEISPRLTLNEASRDRTAAIQKFWSEKLNIPLSQFTKPFYQKTKLKKQYDHPENYHGVLRIHVRKSSALMLKMRGYLEGLRALARQDPTPASQPLQKESRRKDNYS